MAASKRYTNEIVSKPSLSRDTNAGCSAICHSVLIEPSSKSISRRLSSLFLTSSDTDTGDGPSFPHSLTPVATSSSTTISNDNRNLIIIIASITAASLLVLTILILLLLRWRRQISRLDLEQDLESKSTTTPAAFFPISPPTLQPMTWGYVLVNRDAAAENADRVPQVIGPRRTL